jgi:hypothetical protein
MSPHYHLGFAVGPRLPAVLASIFDASEAGAIAVASLWLAADRKLIGPMLGTIAPSSDAVQEWIQGAREARNKALDGIATGA